VTRPHRRTRGANGFCYRRRSGRPAGQMAKMQANKKNGLKNGIVSAASAGPLHALGIGRSGPMRVRGKTSFGGFKESACTTLDVSCRPDVRRIHILFFSSIFPQPGNPIRGIFCWQLCKALSAMCEVRVMSPWPWLARLRHRGPKVTPPELSGPVCRKLHVDYPWYWYPP
jgi:hypothetical protein